ncbi:hypothetical protein [Calidifontibacillus oryziterrae]|uniref:hypothetical protein n=1 Tax=Calidifontibacillus oryziterrae TaxID=1191699 RepID=UPI0003169F30|nr:hypothetical protein [Calidifontibacillus oryziterrae]
MNRISLEHLSEKIKEKQTEALKGLHESNNSLYWFGRVTMCQELLKIFRCDGDNEED